MIASDCVVAVSDCVVIVSDCLVILITGSRKIEFIFDTKITGKKMEMPK